MSGVRVATADARGPRPIGSLGGVLVGAVTAVAGALACGGGEDDGGPAVVRTDSAGVEIVTSTRPAWPEEGGWIVADAPRVRIGTLDGSPEQQLFGARDAALLADGRVVVANAGTHELRLYGPDGAFLRALGGEGEGPGEFRDLRAIAVDDADSIFAWDLRNRRMSVFTPDGGFVRSFGFEPPSEGTFPRYRGRFEAGWLLVSANEVLTEPPEDGSILRGATEYLRYGPEGRPAGTLVELPNRPGLVLTRTQGGRVMEVSFWDAPFELGHVFGVGGNELYAGTGETYRIRAIGLDGALRRVVRREVELPLVREVRDALLREELAGVEEPELRQGQAAAYERIPPPERVPAFDELRVGDDGHLWVRRFRRPGEAGRRWDVFAPDGRWLGTVRIPPTLEVYRVGPTYVLGRTRDELDVERVELYELLGVDGG